MIINKTEQIKTLAKALYKKSKETLYSNLTTQIDFDIEDGEVLVSENYCNSWTVYRNARTISLSTLLNEEIDGRYNYHSFDFWFDEINKKEAVEIAEELYNHFLNSVVTFVI